MSENDSYELPPKAYHPSKDEHPGADVGNELWTVGAAEQRLRVDFVSGGQEHGLALAEHTIEDQHEYELEHIFRSDKPLKERLEHADPFLTHQLQSTRTEKDIRQNRENWFNMMYSGLEDKVERAVKSLGWTVNAPSEQTTFSVHTITDGSGSTGPFNHEKTTQHAEFDGVTDFEQHGFTYPFEAVVCHSASGSRYVFLPWYGTLICTCGSKIEQVLKPLCKHELASLLLASDGAFNLDESIDPRFRRLTSRQAMLEYRPERPDPA